ncbi:hypothetical protein AGABI1DRAFT_133077 [Agaricus bisporus var. burnettii JB137-S8]|uniref:Uncharacterized protein n=1 Tax=Agaricus bisporus var. burnettii (strain JB137-S8 / ATCC MYA-4627 / FGSC 10392) TaxID=597362 RepID=K5WV20_AGABU|nr:uncharacterized protein AGABI1DRAFT_133077 [Agaricus bisporus var. burnettii JB137-S8]EKM74598.1 hypothetical protein AGABI1DRAFT_133077 [Agaricus bisporus var. burnettii JB137-S8]
MSSTAVINDVLPPTVPALDVSGTNWAIFELRFRMVIQGKGLWGHFDGSTPRPTPPRAITPASHPSTPVLATSPSTAAAAVQVPIPSTPTPTVAEIDAWDRNENIALSLLAQRIPDSTLVVVSAQTTVKLMWDKIVRDYTYKSAFSQANLRQDFMSSRCPSGGDVRLS